MSKKAGKKSNAPPAPAPVKEKQPFRQAWINSCYEETLLPNAPWHKLEDEISHSLAQKAEKQFSNPQRKEMIMEILGQHFVDKYLSHVQRSPEVLDVSHMTPDEQNRLRIDAQNWLNSQMYKAVKETGHGYLLTGMNSGEPPPTGAYAEFLQHTFNTFTVGLDRQLYKQEQDLVNAKASELNFMKKKNQVDIFKIPAPSRVKPVGTASSVSSASTMKPSTSQLKDMVQTVEGDPPPLWGVHSDAIGAAVASVLQRDPRKFELVAGRMHGRQLPGTLRTYMWADVLFKEERRKMKEVFVDKVVRERFALAVSRGLQDLKMKAPTQSPINGLIQNAVIETYSKVTSMVPYKQMDHMKESIRTLNVLYVYDRSYEPYLIHWLFPIQLAFRNKQAMSNDKGEHVLELAMYLDLLNSNCFPSWPHVFNMAEQVMNKLEEQDAELFRHLKKIAPINAQVNPKEFMVQLLHQERDKGEAMMKGTTNTPRAPSSSTQFLADPTIFLRRWIGEGFVSVLDTPGVMYIWDQLFMQFWKQSAIINVCLSLMELLRHHFMHAYDYVTMKEVFLMEPCKLYTMDVQMAWIHVENNKNILDISDVFNRQRPQTPESRLSQIPESKDSPLPGMLRPCGIKNIRTSVSFPTEAVQREPWLANLKAHDLRLNVGVYFGSIKLRSRLSHSLPVIASTSKDSYGSLEVHVEFPDERYIYDMLDLSQYDVERELGAYPYAIFTLECMWPMRSASKDRGPVILGWGRVPLYRQVRRHGDEIFSIIEGDVTVSLHPGEISDSFISTQPQTPPSENVVEGSLIGYNCTISTHVFDPDNEPPGRQVSQQTPSPPPVIPQVPPIATNDAVPPLQLQSPSPQQPVEPEPEPEPEQEGPEEDEESDPWVPHQPALAKKDPKPTTNRDPFVLYIDGVRYIPDNASIIKVTGRILRAGDITNLQDILAAPELDNQARSPSFNFSMVINEGRQAASPQLLLFLRVYTVDIVTEKLVVVGSCLVPVFNKGKKATEGLLRVGGHQMRLHSGMPHMTGGLNEISPGDFDQNPIIPGCSVLVRLLPYTQDLVPAPNYSTGYYKSDTCKPTASEIRIFQSYSENLAYPKTEKDMIKRLQQSEKSVNIAKNNAQLVDWLLNRLDIKRQLSPNIPADNLTLMRCVRYRIKMGLNVEILSAAGLPEGLYIQCFAHVAAGKQAKMMSPTEEGYGKEEVFITSRLARTSPMVAPVWEDGPQELHPFYDENTCVILEVIGLKVMYKPQANHKAPGTLHKPDGTPLEISEEQVIGWTVMPLFNGNSVLSGVHTLPILTCPLTDDLVNEFSTNQVAHVFSRMNWGMHNKMWGASLQVRVWDAHFDLQDVPDMPSQKEVSQNVGEEQHIADILNQAPGGLTQQDMLLSMLEQKVRKQGLKGTTFKKEMAFFESAMGQNLQNIVDDYCMRKGLPPLPPPNN